MHTILSVLLMGTPQGSEGGSSPLLYIGLIILIFYFFLIRPQQKKLKEAKVFRESLEKGSRVVTIGGIHGKIETIKEDGTVIIKTEGEGKLKIDKSALSPSSGMNEAEMNKRR